jgi:hypothetical protein
MKPTSRPTQLSSQIALIRALHEHLDQLENELTEISAFNTWFMSSEWEARMANNSSALRLGWDIQNILYEWQDFPDTIPAWRVERNIREAMSRYDVPIRTLAPQRDR